MHTQSAKMINGKLASVEKSVDGEVESTKTYVEEASSVEHPMDKMIDHAYVMTSNMPLAGPYVKRAMDEVHFKWMVQEFTDVIFKPFFPVPKK